MRFRLIPAFAIVLLTSACTVGPDYERPGPESQSKLWAASEAPAVIEIGEDAERTPAPDTAWWKALGDETLAELVAEAERSNVDLEIARARVREARALRRAVRAGGRPSVGAGASGRTFRQSGNTPTGELADLGFVDLEDELYDVGFDAGWEIDLFGRVRRGVEAADARLEAQVEAERGVLLTVIAEVVRNYAELRGAQRRLELAEKNVRLQAETAELVGNKVRAGLVSPLDARRADAQLEATRAQVPPVRASLRAAAHRLAVLTGREPGALLEDLLEPGPLTDPPDLVPVGLPAQLLARRPDVRAAERQLAAATADVGVAVAELYPRVSLTGALGLESRSFADLFESASRTWSLGPSVSWPIFRGGQLRAGVEAAEARRDAAYAGFQKSVLEALEEVESALVAYAEEELSRRALARSAAESERAVEIARVLYDKGLEDFLPVLDAERTLTEIEDRLAASETAVVVRLAALYKALGGGWQSDLHAPSAAPGDPAPAP